MATAVSARELAEERAEKSGKKIESFESVGKDAVRSLDLQTIGEGVTVKIPEDYNIFEQDIRGNKAYYIVTEEGLNFYPSVLTRGAMPLDGSEYVRPSGTVVEKCQEYASMDQFLKECLAGKKIKFTKKTPVTRASFTGDASTVTVNVWQVDFTR